MRVVLDSNVLVRAVASPHGPAGELFERLCAQHVLISSPEMVVELAEVLDYQRIRRLHGLSDEQIAEFIDTIETGALLARCPASLPRVVPVLLTSNIVNFFTHSSSGEGVKLL